MSWQRIAKALAQAAAPQDEADALLYLQRVKAGLEKLLPGPVVPEGTIPKKISWKGLRIDVENPRGTWRVGAGWQTYMLWDYGYIRKTEGADGDAVDVYVGPDPGGAKEVYVVRQRAAPAFDRYDEDKCMLGFCDAQAAKRAYEAQYDKGDFFGGMDAYPADQFAAFVKEHGKAPGGPPAPPVFSALADEHAARVREELLRMAEDRRWP